LPPCLPSLPLTGVIWAEGRIWSTLKSAVIAHSALCRFWCFLEGVWDGRVDLFCCHVFEAPGRGGMLNATWCPGSLRFD
jgi:hypothetical protein